ncbi:MAG TPA: hypothetical protein P5572_07575 [Phycisphaerae bacterium]|nr:hypothetical protein [Phycisphaerae bacterium]
MRKVAPGVIAALALVFAAPAEARTIQFAGINWTVKNGVGGPGPNNWSDSTQSVWVDAQGRLHLKIRQSGGVWYCSEVIAQQSFGYARYTTKISSNPELNDPNAVVGLFTYKNDNEEIDIELTKWGNSGDPTTGQFAVQPSVPNTTSRVRFATGLSGTNPPSTHHFSWQPDYIYYQSYRGHDTELAAPSDLMQEHTYVGSKIPPLSDATFRINFWMYQGRTPTAEMELIVDDVIIAPVVECTDSSECDDGLFCTGVETCVNNLCQTSAAPCTGPLQGCNEALDVCECNLEASVTADDLAWFSTCVGGPETSPTGPCLCADRDADGDADLRDYAALQAAYRAADTLFDFESGSQGWFAFGNGTLASGVDAGGSSGQGRYHTADFDDPTMTYGFGDRSSNGVDLTAYSAMSIDARLTNPDPADPFIGTPQIEFMLSIGYLEWAKVFTLTDSYQTLAVNFADLVPQSSANQPVTAAQLGDPGMRIKLVMRKNSNTGKVRLEYDEVKAYP